MPGITGLGRAIVLLTVALLAAGCLAPAPSGREVAAGPREGQGEVARKRVVAAIRGMPASMVQQRTQPPGVGSIPGLDALEELVHAGLTRYDGAESLVAQLAEAVPTVENGLWRVLPDGRMETTWRIRETARWQDGTPLTGEDLLFTLAVDQDPSLGIPRNPAYDLVESAAALDPRTITVTWKQPYIEADALFSYVVGLPLPRHLLERGYREDPASFLAAPYWTHEFVGAGPYRVRDWAQDSHVVLEAYDGYVLGAPRVREIELRFIPDPNALMANVLAGVELTLGRALSLDQALQIRDQWSAGRFALKSGASLPTYPQLRNPNPQVIADVRFRRALLEAIDRQQIVDTLMAGQSTIAHTFISPDDAAYRAVESGLVRYAHDPNRAVQAITALDYTRRADGGIVDGSGARLTVPISATVQNDRNVKTATAVASDWRRIGVEVEEILIPLQRAQDREYRAQFPGFEIASSLGGVTARTIGRFHSTATPLPENGFRVIGNNARYQSPELDGLVERYLITIPSGERQRLLAAITRHQSEHLPLLPLFYEVTPTMVAHRLLNVSARGERFTEAWNVQEWDVRPLGGSARVGDGT
jgi:peptide/nickel transport system substrate-binding protein